MSVDINEPINVGAVFSGGRIRPIWFVWKGRQVRIHTIAFTWRTRAGSAGILHFSVSDGQGLYEICYNAESFNWRLAKAEA